MEVMDPSQSKVKNFRVKNFRPYKDEEGAKLRGRDSDISNSSKKSKGSFQQVREKEESPTKPRTQSYYQRFMNYAKSKSPLHRSPKNSGSAKHQTDPQGQTIQKALESPGKGNKRVPPIAKYESTQQ